MQSPDQDSTFKEKTPDVGDTVAGRYRIERVLGEGGMGKVFEVEHTFLRQRVALKLLQPSLAKDEQARIRFEREAHSAARLKGEHVARVLDAGRTEGGTLFLAMELLLGNDLDEELRIRGALPVPEAVDYVLQACVGIAEAHALGIVHRDLKPGNLFLNRRHNDGRDEARFVKVVDFGIAKWILAESEVDAAITNTSVALGSPAYMSPEQIRSSKDTDARTDIWALGVILYQLCLDHLPFADDNVTGVLARVLTDPPAAPESFGRTLPAELLAVIARCLSKKREERFVSVAHLGRALIPFAPGHSLRLVEEAARLLDSKHPLADVTAKAAFAQTEIASSVPRTPAKPLIQHQSPKTHVRLKAVAVVAAIVLGLGMLGIFVFGRTNPAPLVQPTPLLVAPEASPVPTQDIDARAAVTPTAPVLNPVARPQLRSSKGSTRHKEVEKRDSQLYFDRR